MLVTFFKQTSHICTMCSLLTLYYYDKYTNHILLILILFYLTIPIISLDWIVNKKYDLSIVSTLFSKYCKLVLFYLCIMAKVARFQVPSRFLGHGSLPDDSKSCDLRLHVTCNVMFVVFIYFQYYLKMIEMMYDVI